MLLSALLLNHWRLSEVAWLFMVCVLLWRLWKDRTLPLATAAPALVAFGAIALLGGTGFLRHPARDALRDLWYFSKPVVEIAFGILVARRMELPGIFRAFFIASIIASAQYIGDVAIHYSDYASGSVESNRNLFGPGSSLSLLGIVLAVAPGVRRQLGDEHRTTPEGILALVLGGVALLMSRSRTLLGLLGLYVLLAILMDSPRLRRIVVRGTVVAVLLVVLLGVLEPGRSTSFLGPEFVSRAVEEVALGDYSSVGDINANWRGYESFLALRQYLSYGAVEKIIGGGLGKMVGLDFAWVLSDVEFEALPVLHNGFLFVLVKTGLLGLVLFLAGLVILWRRMSVPGAGAGQGAGLALPTWLVLGMALATMVISGPYNKADSIPIMVLIGVCLEMAARERKDLPDGEPRK